MKHKEDLRQRWGPLGENTWNMMSWKSVKLLKIFHDLQLRSRVDKINGFQVIHPEKLHTILKSKGAVENKGLD